MSYLRLLNVVVNGLPIFSLRIDFDIQQSNQASTDEPNTGEIKIYNLSPITRKLISIPKSLIVVNAGHLDNIPAPIFLGKLKSYREENTNTEVISVLEVEDNGGLLDLHTMKMSFFYPPLSPASSVIAGIAGFAGTPLASIPIRNHIFLNGFSHSGLLKNALDIVVKDVLKMDWFIDKALLFISDPLIPSVSLPTIISAANGLIGSPEKIVEDSNKKLLPTKKYKFKTMLNPRHFIGQTVTVVSKVELMIGVFKITSLRKYGSNYTNDFYNEYIVESLI